MIRLLFLCTGNSCRSQMAEGWARHLKGAEIDAYSAGIEAHGLNPLAVRVMAEAGVDISSHRSRRVEELGDVRFDYVVTVCGHAHENCPVFPGRAKVVHVGFDDPPKLAKGASRLVNKPELEDSVSDLKEALHAFKNIMRKLDGRVEPLAINLEKTIGAGHKVLEKVQSTLNLVDEVLKPDSPLQYRFIQLTEELAETARSIRNFMDLLERNPNSIIFGKNPIGE